MANSKIQQQAICLIWSIINKIVIPTKPSNLTWKDSHRSKMFECKEKVDVHNRISLLHISHNYSSFSFSSGDCLYQLLIFPMWSKSASDLCPAIWLLSSWKTSRSPPRQQTQPFRNNSQSCNWYSMATSILRMSKPAVWKPGEFTLGLKTC